MSKFFTREEYQKISNLFGLGRVESIFYFRKGFQTPKVLLDTPRGRFVVSKYKLSNRKDIVSKSRQSLEYEIDLLNTLKHLPVPHHAALKSDGFILSFKGYGVTAYRFLSGSPPKKITPRMAFTLGKFVASFHNTGRKFRRNLKGRRKFYELTLPVVKKMEVRTKIQRNHALKGVVEEVKRGVLTTSPPASLPRGPIHVDIKPENELFLGEKLTGVVDFGNFYRGPLMIDVGKAIMWNCCSKKKLDQKLVEKFLAGYTSVRKFNPKERLYLKNSILFAIWSHIWVDLYHVPLHYVPESYTLFLVKNFLPVARRLQKQSFL